MTRDGSGIIAVQIALHERSPVRQKQGSVTVYLRDHVINKNTSSWDQVEPANYMLNRDYTYPIIIDSNVLEQDHSTFGSQIPAVMAPWPRVH